MAAHQRMPDQRSAALLLLFPCRRQRGSTRRLIEIVAVAVDIQRHQSVYAFFHRPRQVFVGLLLVGEQRVATDLRHLDRIQQRGARRNLQVGIVTVPVSAAVGQPHGLAVLLHVRQDQDVGVLRVMELVEHMRLGPAETVGEFEEAFRFQRLAA